MQRSGAPTEATSQYFVAHLGVATPEVEARLVQWGACCVEHRLVRDGKKCLLYFARAESRSVRQMQSLLRTLSARWKLPLGKLESGWCQLLTETEFRDCVPATAAESAREPPQITVPTVAPPLGPCTGAAAGPGVVLEHLSADFDRRAREAYLKLLGRAPTATAQPAH